MIFLVRVLQVDATLFPSATHFRFATLVPSVTFFRFVTLFPSATLLLHNPGTIRTIITNLFCPIAFCPIALPFVALLLFVDTTGSYPTARCVPVTESAVSEYSGISGVKAGTNQQKSPLILPKEKTTALIQPVDHGYCLDSANECPQQGALGMLGGHINYATFLKNVSFFGPRDEYVISGSDSGHLWIWTTASGNLDTLCPEDRCCRVVNVLKADSHTCNGVVPHPIAPVLASYGIDRYLSTIHHHTPHSHSLTPNTFIPH